MAMMNRFEYRKKLRLAIQEALNFIIQDIKEEVVGEVTRRKNMKKHVWVANKELSLLQNPVTKDPIQYFDALHMSQESFRWLQNMVESIVQKSDTVMRIALPASLKLQIVLHLLTTGSSLRSLELMFGVSKTSISYMIPEVCVAIYQALSVFVTVPKTEEWINIGVNFNTIWNFHGCCGAVDGKKIIMKAPSEAGDSQSNSNQTINLLAVCDADYCFKYIEIDHNTRFSAKAVFGNSNLYVALENGLIPENHVLVADATFPLEKYLMIPYGGTKLTDRKKIFNYRLSRAKCVIENAFGIMVSRFRIFEKPIPFSPDKTEKIVRACCALHNWLRMKKSNIQVTTVDVEDTATGNFIPGSWRDLVTEGLIEFPRSFENFASQGAFQVRDKLAEFFDGSGAGAVSWQWRMIY